MKTNKKAYKHNTPSTRFYKPSKKEEELSNKNNPESSLTSFKHRKKGRNNYGRITSRRRGGGHKRKYREIDFNRKKQDIEGKVQVIEYDPNRSANIALIAYKDGAKKYIIAYKDLKVGDTIVSTDKKVDYLNLKNGNNFPLSLIPQATLIHNVELIPGKGAQLVRSAGTKAQLVKIEGEMATIKLPSGEIRLVNKQCRASIGQVGNVYHNQRKLGKAGRNRWLGKRPRVRGVAMNPVDHPMGGGEGKSSGGGHPVSPWGQKSKGFKTRKRSNTSNKYIISRRNNKKTN